MKNFNFKKVLCTVITITMLLNFALVNSSAKTIVRGDVNGDGKVQTNDARLALRAAVALENLDDDALLAADVDGAKGVQTSDARTILRVAAGLEVFENPEIVIEEEKTETPVVDEPTTDKPTTDKPSTDKPSTDKPSTDKPSTNEPTTEKIPTGPVEIGKGEYPKAIDALFSGKFYMKSNIENEDGSVSEVEIAINGNKMEVVMPMEGMKMAVFFNGDTTYVKIKFGIWYVSEITEELKEQGMDFDISSMTENFQYGNIDSFKSIIKDKDTLDGKEYTVYNFISENGNDLCFYADSKDNIKSIVTKNADGKVISRNDITALSANIPSSMFKTSGIGYAKIDLEGLMNMLNG